MRLSALLPPRPDAAFGAGGDRTVTGTVAFGAFELDPARFELREDGQAVSVQPKVLRLLMLLVAERDRCVSDTELLAAVWPDETVSRASIKRAVMGARTALRDRGQGCIRTVRGHGYQFVMPVRTPDPGATYAVEAAEAVEPATAASASAPVPLAVSAPSDFVGRADHLRRFDTLMQAARAGRCGPVWIVGEPGIGKTRLLQALCERAQRSGARVVLGRCMEFDGAPAYWPIVQILRSLLETCGPGALPGLLGPGASDIAEALPELARSLPAHPPSLPIDTARARFRFFDSIGGFLARLAEAKPLVLCIDDLHRADVPTLQLLTYLAGHLRAARILLVATSRRQHEAEPAAVALLGQLARDAGAERIELTGFSSPELSAYVAARTGHPADGTTLARLLAQTNGNPLFVGELLPSLALGQLADDTSADGPRPGAFAAGLHGAIDSHLQLLSAPCRALLAGAAVLGREFNTGLLLQLLGQAPATALPLLAEACQAGVLVELPLAPGRLRFSHALVREVLHGRMPPQQRASRHGRAGQLLAARGAEHDPDLLAEMTEHFVLAAPGHDGGCALRYTRVAAAAAMKRLAYEEAAAHLARALQVLDLGAPLPCERMALLLSQAEALTLAAQRVEARGLLLQVAALARADGQLDVLARVACLLAPPRESGLTDQPRIDLTREVLAALPSGDARVPYLTALLAKALSYTSESPARPGIARRALGLARDLHDPVLRGQALHACQEALTEPETLQVRIGIADELDQLAQLRGDTSLLMHAAAARVQHCVEVGDMAGVDAAVGTLESVGEQLREPFARWLVRTFRAMRAIVAGRLRDAERLADEAFAIGERFDPDFAYHGRCAQVSGIYRFQGRMREAEAITREVSARHPSLAGWRATLACIEAELGHRDRARQSLHQLLDGCAGLDRVRRDPYLLSALCPVADLCVRVGDAGASALLYDALQPYAAHHGNVSYGVATHGPVALHLARLAMRVGNYAIAEGHCADGMRAAEAMASPTFITLACLTHAYLLTHTGDADAPARARALLQRAWTIAQVSQLGGLLLQCQALGSALGLSAPPPR